MNIDFMQACARNHVACIDKLVQFGADIEKRDATGVRLLCYIMLTAHNKRADYAVDESRAGKFCLAQICFKKLILYQSYM